MIIDDKRGKYLEFGDAVKNSVLKDKTTSKNSIPISFTPSRLDFGKVRKGEIKRKTLTLCSMNKSSTYIWLSVNKKFITVDPSNEIVRDATIINVEINTNPLTSDREYSDIININWDGGAIQVSIKVFVIEYQTQHFQPSVFPQFQNPVPNTSFNFKKLKPMDIIKVTACLLGIATIISFTIVLIQNPGLSMLLGFIMLPFMWCKFKKDGLIL